MNKYLLLTTLSIVPIVTFIERSHSSSPCYLIDANGNQVNLGFVCDVIKPTTPNTVTTPPPPTATNNPPVSPTGENTASPTNPVTNVGNVITTPQEETSPSRSTRRILRILDNRSNSSPTNP
ncbi:hypothetical protein [Geminocystis herdmanii]|uniref:hypothetical protein n=1 Tax=Geminocystis herdmanii TaxID=669359 RepID=UPI00118177D5|nr:hypothetical protein [Geminocystis herdmanii]